MKRTDCVHECQDCRYVFSHVPNCDDGEDDSWLCPKCEDKRNREIEAAETMLARLELVA